MRRTFKRALSLFLAATFLFGLTACGNSGESENTTTTKDTLTVAVSTAPITADVVSIADSTSWIVAYNLYTPLLAPTETTLDGNAYGDRGTPTTEGGLVESYSADDSQTVYTFKLKSGIKFNDGNPLTAQNVIETLDYMKSGFLYTISSIKSYEAIDELTFTITLNAPNAYFLSACTSIFPIDFSAIPSG